MKNFVLFSCRRQFKLRNNLCLDVIYYFSLLCVFCYEILFSLKPYALNLDNRVVDLEKFANASVVFCSGSMRQRRRRRLRNVVDIVVFWRLDRFLIGIANRWLLRHVVANRVVSVA